MPDTVGVATPPTREELALALAGAMDETADKAVRHATAMREQAERLVADAARLERDANKLLAGAESLGLEVGERGSDTEEVVDHGTTVNGRGEKVTFELCRDTAQRLGRFSRGRFQEELALAAPVATRWIARMRTANPPFLDALDDGEGGVVYDFITEVPGQNGARPRGESPESRTSRMFGGGPVEGTGRRSQQAKRDGSVTGRRRPGRRN